MAALRAGWEVCGALCGAAGGSAEGSRRPLRQAPCVPAAAPPAFPAQKPRARRQCATRPAGPAGHVRASAVAPASQSQAAHSDAFTRVATEQELLDTIAGEVAAKRLPPMAAKGMKQFYANYRKALVSSGRSDAVEAAVRVMSMVFDRITLQFVDPFTFPSYHRRIREPYDYYMFGQKYVQPLIDYSESFLGNLALFDKIDAELKQGHNVVLLANHQTEADPAVMALMLEATHPYLAENLTYVAGDRVVLDPQCKPFSMGRNLLCVYSKKRINDVPELAAEKTRANRRTLIEMSKLFNAGGQLVWVAPSGGRDRPHPDTGRFFPAHFDGSSVELMRRLVQDAPGPGHLYPLALLCYDIMPPPPTVVKELGEERVIGYHGVGIAVAPELDIQKLVGHIEDRKQARELLSEACYEAVVQQYDILEAAIHGGKGLAAANDDTTLDQPWTEAVAQAKAWRT